MPNKCYVPLCKGNFPDGPKVHTFGFPKNPDLCKKWIQAINKKSLPMKYSRVCELHFEKDDIEKRTTFFVEATGELLSTPLKYPRLKKDAVPSKLLAIPANNVSAKSKKDGGGKRQLQSAVSKTDGEFPPKKRRNTQPSENSMKEPDIVIKQENIATDEEVNKESSKAAESSESDGKYTAQATDSQDETISTTPSNINSNSNTDSIFNPNIVIKQEIIEIDDYEPNTTREDFNFTSSASSSERTKQDKSLACTMSSSLLSNSCPEKLQNASNSHSDNAPSMLQGRVDKNQNGLPAPTGNAANCASRIPVTPSSGTTSNQRRVRHLSTLPSDLASTRFTVRRKDHFDAYGEYIASALRDLDSKTCARVQKAFSDIMFDAEMGKFLDKSESR